MSDEEFERMYYYRCNLHDARTGKCTIYDDRPAMCRNYPQGVKPEQLFTSECGYIKDNEVK
jgi:Fe-S-cluster containining protein